MSFRGDSQRRYGQVPPVQYPVADQYSSQQQQQQHRDNRRLSFNDGDDGAYHNHTLQDPAPTFHNAPSSYVEDELFLNHSIASQATHSSSANPNAASVSATHIHPAYNPQSFAPASNFRRSQSTTTLPYHTVPPSQYSPMPNNSNSTPSQTVYARPAYNPADYANTTAPQRQATYQGQGSHDYNYPQQGSAFGQSPGSMYSSNFSQQMHSPALSAGYQQSLTSPASPPGSIPQAQGFLYNPSQYSAGNYPAYATNGMGINQQTYQNSVQSIDSSSHATLRSDLNYHEQFQQYAEHAPTHSHNSAHISPYVQPLDPSGLQRHPTNAPLPSRPFDEASSNRWNSKGGQSPDEYQPENVFQDSLMQEIEAGLSATPQQQHSRPTTSAAHATERSASFPSPAVDQSPDPYVHHTPSSRSKRHSSFDTEDDDDPEGAAGVLAMRQAELEDQRFNSSAFAYVDMPAIPSLPTAPNKELSPHPEEQAQSSSDSDFGGMDLGMLSGGYAPSLAYGDDSGPTLGTSASNSNEARPLPTPGYFNALRESYQNAQAFSHAEVDYGETGGLQPPRPHRLSFDEGEERMSLHSRNSGIESPTKEEYHELFYHPVPASRPLPAIPPPPSSDSSSLLSPQSSIRHHQTQSLSADARTSLNDTPDSFYSSSTQHVQPPPERSVSMTGVSNTPQVYAPARSRTDAAEERKKLGRPANGQAYSDYDSTATTTVASVGEFDNITLPTGRKRKFIPSKLTTVDFFRCSEPWALSSVEMWLREMALGEPYLREKSVEEALIMLFTTKVPMMNVADAEVLSSVVLTSMLKAGVLQPDEEWVKFGDGTISGVLWQLSGGGCYAPKVHEGETSGRCYSLHCTRTLKKLDLDVFQEDTKPTDEWHVFYNLTKEDLESRPKKEVERQNILHEIVTGEENYIKQLDVFRTLYRDDLRAKQPPIIHPEKRDKFLTTVFGKVDAVLQINKDHLLAQLKYRQQEQGPWITGFSDLFREWIRKAKAEYIKYAAAYPRAVFMVRKELENNLLFKRFLEDKQRHKSSSKQDWTHFLITPLQRLQRYILLLEGVDAKMLSESEEKSNLQKAIEEVKVVTHECDAKVAETNKRVQMMELNRMLALRPGSNSVLNLDHLGRALILEGDLQRLSNKGMKWVDTHALLFDHYMILAKITQYKDGKQEKKYDVSREPIPMPLLFLESMNDEPITKQKGITAPLGRTAPVNNVGNQLNKAHASSSGRPGLEQTPTASTLGTLSPAPTNDMEGKILWPFKIKHLGFEVYTLYASSERDRQEWCTKIVEAKTMHAKALFSQNAEPFRLRVLADASFSYDAASSHGKSVAVSVEGTPLDRSIRDLEGVLGSAKAIAPVCRAQVNCAAGFSAFGKALIVVGTDYGVYITDPSNPRGWARTVQVSRVTQIAVMEEFNVCLLIADRSLISYPLDVIAPVSEFAPPVNDSPRRAPQRLAKDVTYFATAKMKDRTLIFYKRREGLHTSFKVLEPLYHKATEKKSRIFGGRKTAAGSTDTFRDFDEFFFPTECYSLSIFQTYIAVATSKGIEMLTLDKKQPMSIPDVKAPEIANIAARIRDQRPLGMFRLNENEFLLTYEDCAVYVDKHGDVSRTLIMEYTGKQKKASGAAMYGQYLLLFNDDYVEVRNADNGRLRQIIAGRDVHVLDYGIRGPTGGNAVQSQQTFGNNGHLMNAGDASKETVKIAMSHPEIHGRQIILEMLLNDGHSEKM